MLLHRFIPEGPVLPVDARLYHSDAHQQVHEDGKGHHGEAQEQSTVLSDAGEGGRRPSPVVFMVSSLLGLHRQGMLEIPGERRHPKKSSSEQVRGMADGHNAAIHVRSYRSSLLHGTFSPGL